VQRGWEIVLQPSSRGWTVRRTRPHLSRRSRSRRLPAQVFIPSVHGGRSPPPNELKHSTVAREHPVCKGTHRAHRVGLVTYIYMYLYIYTCIYICIYISIYIYICTYRYRRFVEHACLRCVHARACVSHAVLVGTSRVLPRGRSKIVCLC